MKWRDLIERYLNGMEQDLNGMERDLNKMELPSYLVLFRCHLDFFQSE